jgi:hypothetical protein
LTVSLSQADPVQPDRSADKLDLVQQPEQPPGTGCSVNPEAPTDAYSKPEIAATSEQRIRNEGAKVKRGGDC